MLTVTNLSAGYGSRVILKDINFTIEKGERFVVLGTSGCGKSTLMKAIIGLNPPMKGSVEFQGNILEYPLPENTDFYQKIGILYQSSALLNSLTLLENVMLPLTMHHPEFSLKIGEDIACEKLSMVNLYEHRDKIPSELSGGMKKRGALARAMVLDPDIIFFDEPQAGLDPVTTKELDDLFIKLNEDLGITYFMVTHELLSIRRSAQKVLMLGGGGIVFHGSFEDAEKSDILAVKKFFNVDKYGI